MLDAGPPIFAGEADRGRCRPKLSPAPAGRVGGVVGLSVMSGGNASDLAKERPDRRKLVAVMYADMVGYSRLIGLDDQGTLDRLRALRRNIIDPAIDEHG